MITDTAAARWTRVHELVTRAVAQLNDTLGFAPDAKHRVTFGYIGNIPVGSPSGGKDDDRYWSVYLPHPHRVGSDEDRLGFVRSGDADGLAALAGQVLAFRKGILWDGLHKGVAQAANNQAKADVDDRTCREAGEHRLATRHTSAECGA